MTCVLNTVISTAKWGGVKSSVYRQYWSGMWSGNFISFKILRGTKPTKEWELMWCIALDQYNALEGMSVANTSEFTSLGQIPWLESGRLGQKKERIFWQEKCCAGQQSFCRESLDSSRTVIRKLEATRCCILVQDWIVQNNRYFFKKMGE